MALDNGRRSEKACAVVNYVYTLNQCKLSVTGESRQATGTKEGRRVDAAEDNRMTPVNPQSPQSPPAAGAAPSPLLVRTDIANERRTFTFSTPFRIGRTDECEVCIKDEHVSRKHVEVAVENGVWVVKDLKSANGILVNGKKLPSPRSSLNLRSG